MIARHKKNNAVLTFGAKEAQQLTDPVYIIAEGFLLYTDRDLAKLCDIRLWLETDKETICMRRFRRRSKKAQRHWGEQDFSKWFGINVWSSYRDYEEIQLKNAVPVTRPLVHQGRQIEEIAAQSCNLIQVNTRPLPPTPSPPRAREKMQEEMRRAQGKQAAGVILRRSQHVAA